MSEHYINKCSCGKVLSQCRCGSPDKTEHVVKDGCDECKAKAAEPKTWQKMTALELEK